MAGLLDPYDSEDKGLLAAIGRAARTARGYISPWNILTAEDVASNLPGGGIVGGVPMFEEGSKKTKRAREEFAKGNYGDAARFYGSGVLDTATAGLSAAGDVAPMAKLAMTMVPAAKKAAGIRAFHGSPHDWNAERLVQWPDGRTEYIVGKPDNLPDVPDGATVLRDFPLGRVRMDKIGTGEGAQAYGYGWYGAEDEVVAKRYREFLSSRANDLTDPGNLAASTVAHYGGVEEGKQSLRGLLKQIDNFPAAYKHNPGAREQAQKALELLESGAELPLQGGRMYEVRINADPEQFLDWDKPLSEQSEAVRGAIEKSLRAKPGADDLVWRNPSTGEEINLSELSGLEKTVTERTLAKQKYGKVQPRWMHDYEASGPQSAAFGDDPVTQSQALREAGIPGIKYLDAGSRGAGDGTRNYVVFDDKLIEIIRKYGWAPGMAIPAAMALEIERAQREAEGPKS